MGNLHTKGSKVSFVIGEFPDFSRTYSLIRAFSTTDNDQITIGDIPSDGFNQRDIGRYLPTISKYLSEQRVSDLRTSKCVTDTGFTGEELNRHGILKVCLLTTVPFHFDGALTERTDKIQDVRNGQKCLCQNRPKLLESLVNALLSYFNINAEIDKNKRMYMSTREKLQDIWEVLSAYLILQKQGTIYPPSNLKYLRVEKISNSFKTVEKVIQSLRDEDYERIAQYYQIYRENEEKLLTVKGMCDSFTLYGPKRYPLDAILHTVASILIQFSIEEGNRTTVVDRLCKRLQRSSE